MPEIRVLLADDLAVELVLANRAGERACDAHGPRPACVVPGQKHAFAGEQLALQAPGEAARHLHVHRDVARHEHHRPGLRRQLLAGLERDDDRRRVTFLDCRFHAAMLLPAACVWNDTNYGFFRPRTATIRDTELSESDGAGAPSCRS